MTNVYPCIYARARVCVCVMSEENKGDEPKFKEYQLKLNNEKFLSFIQFKLIFSRTGEMPQLSGDYFPGQHEQQA